MLLPYFQPLSSSLPPSADDMNFPVALYCIINIITFVSRPAAASLHFQPLSSSLPPSADVLPYFQPLNSSLPPSADVLPYFQPLSSSLPPSADVLLPYFQPLSSSLPPSADYMKLSLPLDCISNIINFLVVSKPSTSSPSSLSPTLSSQRARMTRPMSLYEKYLLTRDLFSAVPLQVAAHVVHLLLKFL